MPRAAALTTYVAFLRAINVGGRNKVPMADLVEIFNALGCRNVRTYIASGNVVFQAPARVAKTVSADAADRLLETLHVTAPVILRTGDQLRSVAASNPFLGRTKDHKALHVGFLATTPNADRVAKLDPNRSPGDEFRVIGSEIYLYLPNSVADSKLTTTYLDSTLGTVTTSRNWRTVLALLDMCDRS